MKKLFVIVALISLMTMFGCRKHPVADFTMTPSTVYVNEDVHFLNTSVNASSCYWEIGGISDYSWTPSPVRFSTPGEKKVSLTVYSRNAENTMTKYLHVIQEPNGGSSNGNGSDASSEYANFIVTNAHGYPYSITQIRNGVTVETYSIAANGTKTIQMKCGTTEKFTIRQTSGYFQYPNTININPQVINCTNTYSYSIRCSDSYIVCTNYDNSNQYYVDITCPDNGTNTRLVIDGYSKDSLMVDSGFSYTVKFTQKNGYAFSPSTKTCTVDADCGYIYTRSAPDNMKGNDVGNSDIRLQDAAIGRMEIYD